MAEPTGILCAFIDNRTNGSTFWHSDDVQFLTDTSDLPVNHGSHEVTGVTDFDSVGRLAWVSFFGFRPSFFIETTAVGLTNAMFGSSGSLSGKSVYIVRGENVKEYSNSTNILAGYFADFASYPSWWGTNGAYEFGFVIADSGQASVVQQYVEDELVGADTVPPLFTGATVNGAALTLNYDEALDGDHVPAAAAYTVQVAGAARAVSSVAVSGMTVVLTLASVVIQGQTVTVAYTPPDTNPLQDVEANEAVALTAQTVTNNTPDVAPPLFAEAYVDESTLTIVFSEALDTTSVPAASAFDVRVRHSALISSRVTVDSVAVAGRNVVLTLASAVVHGQVVTVAYTAPSADPIQDAADNDAASFTAQSVANNTGLALPTAPTGSINAVAAGVEATTVTLGATLTGGSYDGAIEYAWTVSSGSLSDANVAAPVWTRPVTASNINVAIGLTITVRGAGTNARAGEQAQRALASVSAAVTTFPRPVAPTGSINAVAAGVEATTVTLGATLTGGSYDGAIEYAWTVSSGSLSNANVAAPVWTRPVTASNINVAIGLTITVRGAGTNARAGEQAQRALASVSAAVTTFPRPVAPTGSINAVAAGVEATTVTLGATLTGGSYDGAIEYAWTVSSGSLSNANVAAPVWTRPVTASNINVAIGLTITVRGAGTNARAGEQAQRALASVSAAVTTFPRPVAPTGSINAVAAGNESVMVTLGATLTGGRYDGAIEYRWTVGSGSLNDRAAAAPVWTRPAVTTDTTVTIGLRITVRGAGANARNGNIARRTLANISATVLENSVFLPAVADQSFDDGDIVSITLPAATRGSGTKVYSVSGLPDGLTFDPDTRRISGKAQRVEKFIWALELSVGASDVEVGDRTIRMTGKKGADASLGRQMHLGTADVVSGAAISGLVDGVGPFQVPDDGDAAERIINYTPDASKTPAGAVAHSTGANKGKFLLPAGKWLICAALQLTSSIAESEVSGVFGIFYDGILRHPQTLKMNRPSNAESFEGAVSVTGGVDVDGVKLCWIGLQLDTALASNEIMLQSGHVHIFEQ